MQLDPVVSFLRINGYRDTQPRRLVIEALQKLKEPASPYDIQKQIAKKHGAISIVTVYRIIELYIKLGLVHKHPCSGKLSLCALPGKHGAHGYLHCHGCGDSQEFVSEELSDATSKHAKKFGYTASTPLLEIVGTCKTCSQ